MPSDSSIPRSVADVLDDNATFEPAALAAVRALARSKPWRGTIEEKLIKLNACSDALASAYSIAAVSVVQGERASDDPIAIAVDVTRCRIVYPNDTEYMSVVTFLHAFCRLRGLSVFASFRWSINIFRRCFPASYSRCVHVGPFLLTSSRAAALGLSARVNNEGNH